MVADALHVSMAATVHGRAPSEGQELSCERRHNTRDGTGTPGSMVGTHERII